MITHYCVTLGIEYKILKIAAGCGLIMTVAEALVSDQNVVAIVAIVNFVHSRCNILDINFHTG